MKLGIDPGRYKIGIALTDENGILRLSAILPKDKEAVILTCLKENSFRALSPWIKEQLTDDCSVANLDMIFLGNGTSSEELSKYLENYPHIVADEYGTTLEGRKIYWELHPPKGLWKLVPTSLRVPPRPIDDLAALAIIRKNLKR